MTPIVLHGQSAHWDAHGDPSPILIAGDLTARPADLGAIEANDLPAWIATIVYCTGGPFWTRETVEEIASLVDARTLD